MKPHQTDRILTFIRPLAVLAVATTATALFAQVAPAASATTLAKYDKNKNGVLDPAEIAAMNADNAAATAETVVLSPFEVTTSSDVGYEAKDTLSGSRLNTSLKDVASQVQVMTPEFLKDLAITDINDAIGYSLNVETAAQTYDVTNTNNAGNENGPQAFAGAPRTRGVNGTTIGRDFFATYMPIDTYNTERLTFAPGANSMLFGNSTPAGSIDATMKRAQTNRTRLSADYRFDNLGSERTTLDLNVPLIKNRLAVRWVGLRDRTNGFREPSFRDQDRNFFTSTLTPFRKVSLRVWYEDYDEHAQPVRNTLLKDRVSAWIAAGRPAFDNSVLTGSATAAAPRIRIPAARTNPVYVMDGSGGLGGTLYKLNNTWQTVGQQTLGVTPDNFDGSVTDASLVGRDVAISGNATQNRQHARDFGFVLNANPVKNLFLEAGWNRELFKHRYIDFFRNVELTLFADANKWAVGSDGNLLKNADGSFVANPHFGRNYVEDSSAASFGGMTIGRNDQQRFSATYQLDFTERKSWVKWLGRYNLTGLYDRLQQENSGAGQRFDMRLVNDIPGVPPASQTTAPAAPNATARNLFFRYYLPNAQHPGSTAVNLPFDPMQEGVIALPNSGGALVNGYNGPYGADTGAFLSRTIVHSHAAALQGFLLNDRLVLGYTRRTDTVMRAAATTAFPQVAGGFAFLDKVYDRPGDGDYAQTNIGSKTKSNSSAVAHPFRWLTLRYAKLGNGQVTGLQRLNLDGSDVELGSGAGKEYGVTFNLFDNRLSVSVQKYETFLVGTQTSTLGGGGASNAVPTAAAGGGNIITDDLAALEQAALRAGAPISQKYAAYDNALLLARWPGGFNPSSETVSNRGTFDFIVDRQSKGYELTITGNPTPQWRLAVSGAQNESMETNLAPQYFAFIKERLPVWAQHLNAPTWRDASVGGGNTQTVGQLLQPAIGNFYFIQRSAGQPNAMDRKYRFTATTRYSFREGWRKGITIGANYKWFSPAAVAFTPITVTDNPFLVPGVSASTLTINDPLNPIRGGSLTSFDALAGYGRRLFKNKVMWSVQLNVRNVLNRDGLLVQRATSTGQPTVFTAQEPRSFIITNSFTF